MEETIFGASGDLEKRQGAHAHNKALMASTAPVDPRAPGPATNLEAEYLTSEDLKISTM